MSKRDIEFYIVDIFIAHNKIKRYISKFDTPQDFLYSELEWDASIRQLEIIGEATKFLIRNNTLDKSYKTIVNFRNHINHEYFGIDENIVWDVVTNLLEQYIKDLKKIVEKNKINLTEIIKYAKIDYKKNKEVINFLQTLENEIMEAS